MALQPWNQWHQHLAHAYEYDGDPNDCAVWHAWAKPRLAQLLTRSTASLSRIFVPTPSVEVRIFTKPNRIYVKAGLNLFVTVADRNSLILSGLSFNQTRKGRLFYANPRRLEKKDDFVYGGRTSVTAVVPYDKSKDDIVNSGNSIIALQGGDWRGEKHILSWTEIPIDAENSNIVQYHIGGQSGSCKYEFTGSTPQTLAACLTKNTEQIAALHPLTKNYPTILVTLFQNGQIALTGLTKNIDPTKLDIGLPVILPLTLSLQSETLVTGFTENGKTLYQVDIVTPPDGNRANTKQKITQVTFDQNYTSITETVVYEKPISYYRYRSNGQAGWDEDTGDGNDSSSSNTELIKQEPIIIDIKMEKNKYCALRLQYNAFSGSYSSSRERGPFVWSGSETRNSSVECYLDVIGGDASGYEVAIASSPLSFADKYSSSANGSAGSGDYEIHYVSAYVPFYSAHYKQMVYRTRHRTEFVNWSGRVENTGLRQPYIAQGISGHYDTTFKLLYVTDAGEITVQTNDVSTINHPGSINTPLPWSGYLSGSESSSFSDDVALPSIISSVSNRKNFALANYDSSWNDKMILVCYSFSVENDSFSERRLEVEGTLLIDIRQKTYQLQNQRLDRPVTGDVNKNFYPISVTNKVQV